MHSGKQTPDAAVRCKRDSLSSVYDLAASDQSQSSSSPVACQILHVLANQHPVIYPIAIISSWSCSCVRIIMFNIIIVQSFNTATNAFTSLSSRSTLCAASK